MTLDQRPFASGRRVARHVLLALVATAVVPPLLASGLNGQRESSTRRMLRQSVPRVIEVVRSTPRDRVSVTCGDGRPPEIDHATAADRGLSGHWMTHEQWITLLSPTAHLEEGVLAADAWDRCVMVRAGSGLPPVLLSAGANGLVETPVEGTTSGGDDILVVAAAAGR